MRWRRPRRCGRSLPASVPSRRRPPSARCSKPCTATPTLCAGPSGRGGAGADPEGSLRAGADRPQPLIEAMRGNTRPLCAAASGADARFSLGPEQAQTALGTVLEGPCVASPIPMALDPLAEAVRRRWPPGLAPSRRRPLSARCSRRCQHHQLRCAAASGRGGAGAGPQAWRRAGADRPQPLIEAMHSNTTPLRWTLWQGGAGADPQARSSRRRPPSAP